MEAIRGFAASLITEHCAKTLLDDFNVTDIECLKITASKAVGIAIVAGSAVMKVPQIINILPGDTEGLSLPRFVIETMTFSTLVCYNSLMDYPFSTWGENLFLLLQNYVIVALILIYRKQIGITSITLTFLYFVAVWLMISGTLESMSLQQIQLGDVSIPLTGPGSVQSLVTFHTLILAPFSRILQIYKSWSEGTTGQLSIATQFLAAAGSVVRALTVIKEVDDTLLISAVVVAALLNNIVFGQIVYYNYVKGVDKKKKTE
ncbi:hypothetical protein AAMO2058_000014900 [Amorphochlora amoebiformis]|eukprot:1090401-Amorphochlora_amoeboformis.AAC.1